VADDLDFGRIHLVAVRVVEVPVRVRGVAHGVVGDRAQVLDEGARRRGRNVRIDEEHVRLVNDHAGVRSHNEVARPARVIDPRHDLREREVDRLRRGGAALRAAALSRSTHIPVTIRGAPGKEPRSGEDASLNRTPG